MIVAKVLFWVSAGALLHSYIIYPLLLKWMAKGKALVKNPAILNDWPAVSVVMAVYNEESVIKEKIDSFLKLDYPRNRIELIIGSDGSDDLTEGIIEKYQLEYPNIQLHKFTGRTGKSGILNQIIKNASGSILIFTDANIYFDRQLVKNLVLNFKSEFIGLVGANIINTNLQRDGIAYQEKAYIQRENMIKYYEGVIWGNMMGAFGACYAMRKELFKPLPPNHLMEDFYITMHVIKAGFKSVLDLQAIAYEDVSTQISEEFKRKVRISAGNFQNLSIFYSLLWPVYKPNGFSFLSHKVIRWLGPILLCISFFTAAILSFQSLWFAFIFWFILMVSLSPLIDWIITRLNMYNFAIRLCTYFLIMNLALLVGFMRYLKGIKSSAWQPTVRNIK